MNEESDVLQTFVHDVLNANPTFSEEMIEKIRSELTKAFKDAEDYYKKKAED